MTETPKPIGPNVRRLIAHKAALMMVPPGCGDGKGAAFAVAINALATPGNLAQMTKAAAAWVEAAITAVRNAPGGAAYGDDEAIAGEILRSIKAAQERRLARQ